MPRGVAPHCQAMVVALHAAKALPPTMWPTLLHGRARGAGMAAEKGQGAGGFLWQK